METCYPTDFDQLNIYRSTCGRADLLQALAMAQGDKAREIALADILGFAPLPEKLSEIASVTGDMEAKESAVVTTEKQQHHVIFRPYHLVAVDTEISEQEWQTPVPDSSETGTLTADDMTSWNPDYAMPQTMPIVPWTRLWPRLRKAVAHTRASAIDIASLTKQISQGVAVRRLPRKMRLTWPNQWSVVLDFSDRLTPYWDDWHGLRRQLQNRFKQQIRFYRLHGIPQQQLQPMNEGRPIAQFVNWPKLSAGDTLLLASDLGMVDPAHPWPAACWQNKLAEYRRSGVRVIVLAPISASHLQASLVNLADVIRLSADSPLRPIRRIPAFGTHDVEEIKLSSAAQTLLTMMSVASRVEPALLRELRACLPLDGHDIGLEAEVWCFPELDTAPMACALGPWAVQKWRQKFAALPEPLQQQTLDCLRRWHARLPQALHHEETLLWWHLTNTQRKTNEANNIERARQFFIKIKNTLLSEDAGLQQASRALQTQLADHHLQWVTPTLANAENYLAELSIAVAKVEPERTQAGLPVGMNPVAWLKTLAPISPERLDLLQGPDLHLILAQKLPEQQVPKAYSLLVTIDLERDAVLWAFVQDDSAISYRPWFWREQNKQQAPVMSGILTANVEIEPQKTLYLHTGQQRLCFEQFSPPAWATAWGQDRFGVYADFSWENITQRFRWIPPGSFLMGSPESEPERESDEVQHKVVITQGYWLADSACTQAFWTTVMADNPSEFQDNDNNPVEVVSWDDVQQFIATLNQRFTALQARLPSEAEWEYACRAATTTPFSFGDNITPEQVNYDGEHPYANGKEGLFRRQTVPVKSLPPNPWGLYEMHSNVWEWCQDWFGDYSEQAVTNSVGPEAGVRRVLRGGSWNDDGRYVRSAFRSGSAPGGRDNDLGFRLALGQAGVSGKGRLRAAAGRTAVAEPGSQAGRSPKAGK